MKLKFSISKVGFGHLYMDYKDKGYVNVTYFDTKNEIILSMK